VYLADGLVELLLVHVAEHCPGDDPARWLFGHRAAAAPEHSGLLVAAGVRGRGR
jgi:hypothetical protein